MIRYIFIPDAKNGKQLLAGVRGNLVVVEDPKVGIATSLPVLTVKPLVTDYIAHSSK
jgi:hypothetical protein